jgi:site-specific recombinase XerD
MLETLFNTEATLRRHRDAPLLAEREAFLRHRQMQGTSPAALRAISSALINVTIGLGLSELRDIDMDEIEMCARKWAMKRRAQHKARTFAHCAKYFIFAARRWFLFLGKLTLPDAPPFPFATEIAAFEKYMTDEQGLTALSVKMQCFRASSFLKWYSQRHRPLNMVRFEDVDKYMAMKAMDGCGRISIAGIAGGIRAFFRYAERQKWCRAGLAECIYAPRIYKQEGLPEGPTREQVAELFENLSGKTVPTLRVKALFALFIVYGLRCGEVSRLRMDDFDWTGGTFLVHHSKRGGSVKYPLDRQVGETILEYITKARPKSSCPNLFLTLTPPYREVEPTIISHLISKRLRKAGIRCRRTGPHALRYSCATRLLDAGMSIKEIGDYLGHHHSESTAIYAKVNLRMLRQVADLSLEGLL